MPEKQVIKPIVTSEVKGKSEIKPRLGQGRADLRWKIKSNSPSKNKPNVKLTEKPTEQSKVASTIPTSESSSIQDKMTPVPHYAIPQTRSSDDPSSRMVKRKLIQDVNGEIPRYQDPVYRPPPKLTEIPIQEIPKNLSDFEPEINMDFEEICHFKRVWSQKHIKDWISHTSNNHKNWLI